jgi:uncharacterized protein
MAISISSITNCNVYMDGKSMLGRAEEIELPELKFVMKEHKALGMFGAAEFPSGLEKMTAKIKWNSFYDDTMRGMSNPFKAVQLQARGSVEVYTGQGRTSEVPMVAHLTGTFKSYSGGKFTKNNAVDLPSEMAITYFSQHLDGVLMVEVDVMNNIFRNDAEDMLSKWRTNQGG